MLWFYFLHPNPMTQDLSLFTLEQLQQLYADANAHLMDSLLMGADWEELREERIRVTCIAREIHHRKYPLGETPAESPIRYNY